MNWRDHIHSDPAILGGKPVIRGTRISVELVLEHLADGGSVANVTDAYAQVVETDVRAVLAFADGLVVDEDRIARQRAA
jgi:uncharacterized protein (DUF433 family)